MRGRDPDLKYILGGVCRRLHNPRLDLLFLVSYRRGSSCKPYVIGHPVLSPTSSLHEFHAQIDYGIFSKMTVEINPVFRKRFAVVRMYTVVIARTPEDPKQKVRLFNRHVFICKSIFHRVFLKQLEYSPQIPGRYI